MERGERSQAKRASRICQIREATVSLWTPAGNGNVPTVEETASQAIMIAPGAAHLPHFLSVDHQCALAAECRALLDGPVPAYVPQVRGGGRMHVRMLCLGRHWNGKTYTYERSRSDY